MRPATEAVATVPPPSRWFDERLLTWNAGGCCGFASDAAVDDVGFALHEIAARTRPRDAARMVARHHGAPRHGGHDGTAEPFDHHRDRPRAETIMPSVAMKGGMRV